MHIAYQLLYVSKNGVYSLIFNDIELSLKTVFLFVFLFVVVVVLLL